MKPSSAQIGASFPSLSARAASRAPAVGHRSVRARLFGGGKREAQLEAALAACQDDLEKEKQKAEGYYKDFLLEQQAKEAAEKEQAALKAKVLKFEREVFALERTIEEKQKSADNFASIAYKQIRKLEEKIKSLEEAS